MKIIDLLNKIANGEEVPFLIKYEDIILKYDLEGQDYRIYQDGYLFTKLFEREDCKFLNDEVEILEEEKKIPEKLNLDKDELLKKVIITAQDYVIEGKINEIIDYLDYLKSKGE